MPILKRNQEPSSLDQAIDSLHAEMAGYHSTDPEYAECVKQLSKLYKLKEINPPERVKPDTVLVVAGNIAVALLIIGFEQKHVVTTKVTSFLTKLR